MEPQDAEVGFWVKDALYVFTPSAKIETAKREYLVEIEQLEKLRGCSGWASLYFQIYNQSEVTVISSGIQISSSEDRPIYRNGRPFYFFETYPTKRNFEIQAPIPDSERSELCSLLADHNNVDYDMSALICTRFSKRTLGWNELFELMKRCTPASVCDPCTHIGYKIAKSLIKIAALRIFADPEQSIMELPVNSLDAYNPDRKIGKFGMGFFSILYWLIGHPKRTMTIHSFSKDEKGKRCTYRVVIREIDGVLSFNLVFYPLSEITTTGFRVSLEAPFEDPFTLENVNEFNSQLKKLSFASGAKILTASDLLPKPKNKKINRGTIYENKGDLVLNKTTEAGSENQIITFVSLNFILVEDYATGVPLEVMLGSLFVPSISTKTIQLSNTSNVFFENNSGLQILKSNEKNRLVILVGGIAVVSITSDTGFGNIYVIHMPYNTRLPVSRDDIIITPENTQILSTSIEMVFDDLMRTNTNPHPFQNALNKYKDFTPNPENQRIVAKVLSDFFEANKSRLVPEAHIDLYKYLAADFVASNQYDALAIERRLNTEKTPITNLWYGVKVLYIPSLPGVQNITNGGLLNYLFISETYKQKLGAKWVETITTSYFETKLYPYASSYGGKDYEKYNKIDLNPEIFVPTIRTYGRNNWGRNDSIGEFFSQDLSKNPRKIYISDIITDPALLAYFYAVLVKYESLSIYFVLSGIFSLVFPLIRCYLYFSKQDFISILGELVKKFSSFIGNQTYGAAKNVLIVESIIPEIFSKIFLKPAGQISTKMVSYLVDHIIYSIRAVEEKPTTYLNIGSVNNPYQLYKNFFIDSAYTKAAFELSSNIVEFTILVVGSGRPFYNNVGIPLSLIEGFIEVNLQEIRSKKYGVSTLVGLYEMWGNKKFSAATSSYIFLNKMYALAEEWIRNVKHSTILKTVGPLVPPAPADTVKLGVMINTLFKENLPEPSLLPSFLKKVSLSKEESPLQIIEIAVNEGTVKPFVEATLTEIVQNSIDAIREFGVTGSKSDTSVHISLEKAIVNKKTNLILSIEDHVGMTSDAFIYVGIPFLSTKSPSEMVTGEMGSGFFNAYREAAVVRIYSTKDGITRESYDVPILDERNRVVDIQKTIRIKKTSKARNKTIISIQMVCKDDMDEIQKITRIEYMIKNVLALASQPIVYNKIPVSITKELAAKFGYFELYYTDPNKTKHESYLLTKGIPFAPLASYFKDYLMQRVIDVIDRNFVVNITHGGYTPVQTRTRINIPKAIQADFARVAEYTVFITMVRELAQGHRKYALDHIDSTANAVQLHFTNYSIFVMPGIVSAYDETSYLKYTSFYGQPSIASLINSCIDVMGGETYDERKTEIAAVLETWKSPYENVNKMVREIAIMWLKPKNTKHKPPAGEEGKVKKKEKGKIIWVDPDTVPDEPDPQMEPIVKAWINTFWGLAIEDVYGFRNNMPTQNVEIMKDLLSSLGLSTQGGKKELIARLGVKIRGRAFPKIVVVNSIKEQSKSGWYESSTHTITINTESWDEKDRKEIISVLGNKNLKVEDIETKLKNNKTWDYYFGYRFPSATLPHELEHARRSQNHDAEGHGGTKEKLFEGGDVKQLTFDQTGNAVFQHILSKGFYQEFFNALKR